MHFRSSALRASPRMNGPRRGTRHGPCSFRARPLPVLPTRVARSPRPSSAPGNLSRSMRTRFARADVAGNFTTFFPALLSPALSWRLRRSPLTRQPPRQRAPAERRPGQAADLLPGIQQNHRFTGRRTRLPVPRRRACRRTSTSKRCSQALPVNRTVRRHTRRPPLPRPDHASCEAPCAPVPHAECRRGRRHLDATLLLCGLRNR